MEINIDPLKKILLDNYIEENNDYKINFNEYQFHPIHI